MVVKEYDSMISVAEEDAKKISKFLHENYAGKLIKKTSIRMTFNLPYCRAVYVFEFLEQMGFIVDRLTVSVPQKPPPVVEKNSQP